MSQAPIPQPSQPPPPLQQLPQQMPAYPQAGQEAYLVTAQPQLAQPIPYYTPMPEQGSGIWSYGKTLVMHKQAQLPPVCIKCCAPAEGEPLKRKLVWHTPWLYLLFLAGLPGLVLLFIIALCIQKRATIYVGLCSRHRRLRKINLTVAWGIFASAIVAFVVAADTRDRNLRPILVVGGIFLALIAPVYGLLTCRLVIPSTIDEQYIWLKGACREFVAQFPGMLPRY